MEILYLIKAHSYQLNCHDENIHSVTIYLSSYQNAFLLDAKCYDDVGWT